MSEPYIFVAYKPDSANYRMGCHMKSYSAEFKFEPGLSEEDLIIEWASCLDFAGGTNEIGWEEIHVINRAGDVLGFGTKDEYDRLRALVDQELEWRAAKMAALASAQAAELQRKATEEAERQAVEHEKHERAEYARLCRKFEDGNDGA